MTGVETYDPNTQIVTVTGHTDDADGGRVGVPERSQAVEQEARAGGGVPESPLRLGGVSTGEVDQPATGGCPRR